MKTEKVDKKQAILAAAEKLFCETGYEGTSTRQIAKESGANMAMINYYFGSKEGVFVEIMNERIAGFASQLKIINEDKISALEKLHKVIEGYVNRIMSNTAFHKMMHRELSLTQRPEMYDKIKDAMSQNMQLIDRIITGGIEDGSFNKVDVRMVIATIMGTITNIVIAPHKVMSCANFDLNNPKDKKIIKERAIAHLQDLTTVYLTTKR
ncbi:MULTISPECIES: TetR/AcrR family transcriptional regulator [unclassified Pedobacter]|uniref:TetR/AcrR family transcriptional regulator n=1 Tax=unclassified Pedobacter TaxID=2628915 RepID=UPI0014209618|nr:MULTISPECIES: TetR family transcriptional regulator [unclassified Pedobacter]NII84402.1 AcrR family transcriptional regulator [Pedobacter sp. SG908]NMN38683.1 AcrR family transcriptional regulator [Pedobacter sp. SG918]